MQFPYINAENKSQVKINTFVEAFDMVQRKKGFVQPLQKMLHVNGINNLHCDRIEEEI